MVPVTRQVVLDGDTPVTGLRQAPSRPLRLPARVARGRRAVGALHLSRDRPARGVSLSRPRVRALDARPDRLARGRADVAPLEHLGARCCAATRRSTCPACPASPAAPSGYLGYDIVRTIESLPDAAARRPGSARRAPDGGRHAARARQPVQPRDRHRERRGGRPARTTPSCAGSTTRPRRGSTTGSAGSPRRARSGRSPSTCRRRCRRPRRPTPTTGSRTTCAGSRSTSRPATPFRRCSRGGSTSPAPDPFLTYRYLRALNPAPYLYYLHCDDIHVIGSSPEILVRVEDGEVTLRPIAGTRPRGATPERDAALAAELAADPKERAEHLMLVDLGRNDVGRVAEFGSVRLTAFMAIERYSPRHAPGERGARPAPARARRGGRARGVLPRRHGDAARPRCGRCRSSTSSSRCAAAPTPARWATSAGARDARHGDRDPHLRHAGRPRLGPGRRRHRRRFGPARPNGGKRRPRRGRCCWRSRWRRAEQAGI